MGDDVLGTAHPDFTPTLYALSAVVYAERDGQILLLNRLAGIHAERMRSARMPGTRPGGVVEEGDR